MHVDSALATFRHAFDSFVRDNERRIEAFAKPEIAKHLPDDEIDRAIAGALLLLSAGHPVAPADGEIGLGLGYALARDWARRDPHIPSLAFRITQSGKNKLEMYEAEGFV